MSLLLTLWALLGAQSGESGKAPVVLESPAMVVEMQPDSGTWSLRDKASGVRWPSEGAARCGSAEGLQGPFTRVHADGRRVRLSAATGATVRFELVDEGRSLEIGFEGKLSGSIRLLDDALAVTDSQQGAWIVPCREGLLVPADSGVAFKHTFGASEYEGCHMNMLGALKGGSVLAVTWDGVCVWAELESKVLAEGPARQRVTAALTLRPPAHAVRLTPLGRGDWNTLAAGYRRLAEQKGLAVPLARKIQRNPRAERLVGASNVKLWTCLARRMNEESTKEESVTVRWTFDEAAQIAEHLHKDLGIDRCLFIMGGWTEGGYDCRHPDNLPANPECGGNAKLAEAIQRVQALGFVACLHDNYQDMYRDARSWNPAVIEKRPDGSLIQGGRWLGGRAYMVCASKQLELAMRPQNLPEIHRLFRPWAYFIDCTFAVGPRECADPNHPLTRDDDVAWKIRLSDQARELFGLFGSECGREWAVPHSDFFEGLVGVSGRYYHNLKPESLGATVIPFWEMVYHDCQICFGKYGYSADQAGQYVAHHVLCARPLHYHSIPDHLYWKDPAKEAKANVPSPQAAFARTDQGWAEGLHPTDAFLKTTHEVLGPLHAATAHERLVRLEFLTPDKSLRRAHYGQGERTVTVVVNFGQVDATAESQHGGRVVLPPSGFVIDGPQLAAFYAKRWNGVDYPGGALFTLRSADQKPLAQSARVRVFHGFGDPRLTWGGTVHRVPREAIITMAR